jgi:predicted alpha/beta hydrolase
VSGPGSMLRLLVPVAPVAAAVLVALAGCGGDDTHSGRESQLERVHFRASDGVLLDGRMFGSRGRGGVVLVHMGRPGDSQADWAGLARLLARDGYLVLTFDRRGVCPRAGAGCSRGTDDYASSWRDVVGAIDFLRGRGIRKAVVLGASIGAMSSLYAAATHRIEPAGLIEFAGINHASGYDFDRAQIRGIGGLKVFLSSRNDIYGGGVAAREWFRWASPPKRLELVPGSDHGTDLLRHGNPARKRVEKLIVRYVNEASG